MLRFTRKVLLWNRILYIYQVCVWVERLRVCWSIDLYYTIGGWQGLIWSESDCSNITLVSSDFLYTGSDRHMEDMSILMLKFTWINKRCITVCEPWYEIRFAVKIFSPLSIQVSLIFGSKSCFYPVFENFNQKWRCRDSIFMRVHYIWDWYRKLILRKIN
jgi:hypothetical protein